MHTKKIFIVPGIFSSIFLLPVYGSKFSIFLHNEFFYESNCSKCEFPETCVLDSV